MVRARLKEINAWMKQNKELVYRLLSWSFGILSLTLLGVYGLKTLFGDINVVGESFVKEELPIPFFPWFYAKPITWFSFFTFCWWAFGLESHRKWLLKLKPPYPKVLMVMMALFTFGSLYEIFWNFAIWTALMAIAGPLLHPDLLANVFNVPRAVNLVFATKIVTLVFGMSVYFLYFIHRVTNNFKEEDSVK